MNWVYSPEPEADYLPPNYLVGQQYVQSRSSPTANESSLNGSETGISTHSPSGMISEPLMASHGEDESTSCPEASLAKISQALAAEKDWLMALALAFGSKCCESLAKYNLHLSSRKTPRICALTDFKPFSKDLPTWGLMLHGVCLELGTSVRLTDVTACGSLLPTPTGAGNETSPSMQKWPAHRALAQMLPTPIASDGNGNNQRGAGSIARGGGRRLTADMLPTPTATLYGSNRGGAAGRTGKKRGSLETQTGGIFIALREWMMGWPLLWSSTAPLPKENWDEWLGCFTQRGSQASAQTLAEEVVRTLPHHEVGEMNRVDRVRATGNGQVPRVAAIAFETLVTLLRV